MNSALQVWGRVGAGVWCGVCESGGHDTRNDSSVAALHSPGCLALLSQCLSATWPLTRYFISNRYKADVNVDNVLGTGTCLRLASHVASHCASHRASQRASQRESQHVSRVSLHTWCPHLAPHVTLHLVASHASRARARAVDDDGLIDVQAGSSLRRTRISCSISGSAPRRPSHPSTRSVPLQSVCRCAVLPSPTPHTPLWCGRADDTDGLVPAQVQLAVHGIRTA